VNAPENLRRRLLLKQIVLAASVSTLALGESRAAELPLIAEDDPEAKAVKYVEDGTKVKDAMGNRCDTCAIYQGKDGASQGSCQIFKSKLVKAAGWCTSWAPQM
jgi:hypothetical protein